MHRTSIAIAIAVSLLAIPLLVAPGGSNTGLAPQPVLAAAGAGGGDPDTGPVESSLQTLCRTLYGHVPEDCTTQHDGRSHGDATNLCGPSEKVLPVDDDVGDFTGLLLPEEDEVDHYLLFAPDVGGALQLVLRAQPDLHEDGLSPPFPFLPRFAVTVYLLTPDGVCGPEVAKAEQLGDTVVVSFGVEPRGTYVLSTRLADRLGPDALAPTVPAMPGAAPPAPSTRTLTCHGVCVADVNGKFGYGLHATTA